MLEKRDNTLRHIECPETDLAITVGFVDQGAVHSKQSTMMDASTSKEATCGAL